MLVVSADAAALRRSKKRWIVAMPVVDAGGKEWLDAVYRNKYVAVQFTLYILHTMLCYDEVKRRKEKRDWLVMEKEKNGCVR